MATRSLVEETVSLFSALFGRNKSEDLVNGWLQALKKYRDEDVTPAIHRAMDECQKMPTPTDIIQRMKINQTEESAEYKIVSARCHKCKRIALCISEPIGASYLCRECYSGLSNEQIGQRFADLGKMMSDREFLPEWALYLDERERYA